MWRFWASWLCWSGAATEPRWLQAIRWNAPDRKRALNAVIAGSALALFSDIGELVLHRWIPDSLPITEFFNDRPVRAVAGCLCVLVAPLMEELFFRGFLYPGVGSMDGCNSFNSDYRIRFYPAPWRATGVFMGAPALDFRGGHHAHGYPHAVTKSVATCVIVHMAYNFVLLRRPISLRTGSASCRELKLQSAN